MTTALAVLAALLGLLVLLLAVPLELAFRCEGLEAFRGEVALGWLFGLVRLRTRLPRPGPSRAAALAPGKRKKRRERNRQAPHGNVMAVLRDAAFRRRVVRLLKDMFAALRVQPFRLYVRLGLGDPADTGRLWAILGPLNALAQNVRNAQLRLEPDFSEPELRFNAEGRLKIVPLRHLALVIAFALSPASLRAWRTLRGGGA